MSEIQKTIIWDLDGTLLNSFGVFSEVLGDVLPRHKLSVPTQQVLSENYHGTLDDSIDNALGGVDNATLEKVIADFLLTQDSHYEMVEHHLFPDALELAAKLHAEGAFQVIVTNRNHLGRLNASPLSIVERSSLKGLIDKVIYGDHNEHRKPKPAVIDSLTIEQRRPERITVIGDQFVDAQFAQNLGARAIIVCREGEPVHMERLGEEYLKQVHIVSTLSGVEI